MMSTCISLENKLFPSTPIEH